MEGRPRYLVWRESCIVPKVVRVSSFTSWGVFAEKKIEDLSVLIFCPDASSYLWRIFLTSQHSLLEVLQKRILSSAKKRWVILGQPLQTERPLMSRFLAAS